MNKIKMLLKAQIPFVMVMVAAIGAMLGVGCEKQKIENPQEASQVAQQNTQQQSDTRLLSLENTSWKFVAFVENGETTRVNDDCPSGDCYSLNFENDGKWEGTSSSNDMFGTYTVDGSSFGIQISITTEVGETDDGYKYVDKLTRAISYDSDSSQLRLYINKNDCLLFERRTVVNPASFLIGEWAVNASMSNVTNHNYKDTLVFTTSGTIEKHSILAGMRYYLLNDTTIIFEDTNRTYKKNFRYYPPNVIMFYNFWDNTVLNYIKNVYYEKVEL